MLIVDWERCPDDPGWVRDLVTVLSSEPASASSLPLLLAVRELEEWKRLATSETWGTRANRRALADDLTASMSLIGRHLKAHLSPVLDNYVRMAIGCFSERRADRADAASMPGATLQEAIATAAAVRAVWADLVEAARNGDDDAALWCRCCLGSQISARGQDGSRMLSEAAWYVLGQERRFEVGPVPSLDMRLDRARDVLATDPPAHSCVVWLTYEHADLTGFTATFGPVTFLEADWCLPNAIRDDGQPFTYRDEVRALVAADHDWDFDEENWKPDRSRRPYLVLARVDLGERATAGAIDHAARLVRLILDVARLQGGGAPWRPGGPSLLVADGDVVQERFGRGPLAEDPPDSGDHYGRNAFASALDKYGPTVGRLLDGPIPSDLAEAIRMLEEAGQADDPWRQRGPSQAIDQRTVLALHAAAHDHLATFGRLRNGDELEDRILEDWPMAVWQTSVMRSIDACLSGAWATDPELDRAIRQDRTYRVDVASDRQDELLAHAGDGHVQRTASRWLGSVDHAPTLLDLLGEIAAEGQLLAKRARRVRNGIVHGTPPSPEAVASVMEFSRFRVFRALWYAMEAATNGRPMRDLLDEDRQQRLAEEHALNEGVSLRAQWRARTGKAVDGDS